METETSLISKKQASNRRSEAKARRERPEEMRRRIRNAMQRLRARRKTERWCTPEIVQEVFRAAATVPAQVRSRNEWITNS